MAPTFLKTLLFLLLCLVSASGHRRERGIRGIRRLQNTEPLDGTPTDEESLAESDKMSKDDKKKKATKKEKEGKDMKAKKAKKEKKAMKSSGSKSNKRSKKSVKAAVAGTVIEDVDGDGDGDRPLPEIKVHLKDTNGTTLVSTSTDRHGKYDFSELEGGSYAVVETTNTTCEVDAVDGQVLDTFIPGNSTKPATDVSRGGKEFPSTITLVCTSTASSLSFVAVLTGLSVTLAMAWL